MGVKKMAYIIIVLIVMSFVPTIVLADSEVVAQGTKYFKTIYRDNLFSTYSINGDFDAETVEITKEEYDAFNPATAQPLASGTVETTYKEMTTSISKENGSYVYMNHLSWKNFPATRSYDIIGIAYPNDVTIGTALQFETEYCTATGTCYANSSHNPVFSTTGVGTIFPLPTGSLSRMNHTMYFSPRKNTTSTITVQYIQGDYAHAQHSVELIDLFDSYVAYGSGIIIPDSDVEENFDTFNVSNVSYTENW